MLIEVDTLAQLHEKLAAAAYSFKVTGETIDVWIPRWKGEPDHDAAFDLSREDLEQILACLDKAIDDARSARQALAAAGSDELPPLDRDWRTGQSRKR